jgi:hypothetical protein
LESRWALPKGYRIASEQFLMLLESRWKMPNWNNSGNEAISQQEAIQNCPWLFGKKTWQFPFLLCEAPRLCLKLLKV